MDQERDLREEEIVRLRGERQKLMEQIRESQRTIERSQQSLKRIDELLAKALLKP
jgi:predicted  nucleic acid-binding Zn-ribbon protein